MYTYYNDRKEPTRETGHCAAALSGVKSLQGPLCASAGQVLRGCRMGTVGVVAEGGYRGEGTPVDRIRFSARGRHRCYCVIGRRSGKPDEINIYVRRSVARSSRPASKSPRVRSHCFRPDHIIIIIIIMLSSPHSEWHCPAMTIKYI